MSTILRFAPGESAPSDDMYALVGHFGESIGVAIWCDKGKKLPLAVVAEGKGPIWYCQVGAEITSRAAA
jgi:hypothetical protein